MQAFNILIKVNYRFLFLFIFLFIVDEILLIFFTPIILILYYYSGYKYHKDSSIYINKIHILIINFVIC